MPAARIEPRDPERVRPRRRAAALLVGALLLAGCSAETASTSATGTSGASGAPAPLTATLAQNREDEVRGVAVVRLTNHGETTVHISDLALRWPGLAAADPDHPDYPLAPGVPTDLPVALGAAACATTAGQPDPASTPPADPPAAALTADGEQHLVVMGDADSRALAARLFQRSCQNQAVAAAVDVSFGPAWHPTTVGGTAAQAGSLVLRRKASTATITLTALEGSVLLDLEPASPGAVPLRLSPGTKAAVLPVTLRTSGRCDGHGLGESKKTYVLTALVDTGDGTARPVTVSPALDDRPAIWHTILEGCGVAPPA